MTAQNMSVAATFDHTPASTPEPGHPMPTGNTPDIWGRQNQRSAEAADGIGSESVARDEAATRQTRYDGAPFVAVRASALFDRRRLHRLPVLQFPWLDERPRDNCGRRRSPVTLPGYRAGKAPANKGRRYAPEPLTEQEVFRLLDACPTNPVGRRTRALIVLLWRSGLRIHEALLLEPRDLDPEVGMVHVRRGKGGKAGYSAMDAWAFEQVDEWLRFRARYPHGPVFCVCEGPSKGVRAVSAPSVRAKLHELAREAGISKRVHPHGMRHSLACDLMRSGEFPLSFIQHQLRHSNPATTANYLVGLGADHSLAAVAARPAPSFAVRESVA